MKTRKLIAGILLASTIVLVNPSVSEAKTLISSQGYVTAGGCIYIVNTYEHLWHWTSEQVDSPNC